MTARTTTQSCLLMLIGIVLLGCGSDDGGVSPAELSRRKQLRESRQLSKSKTPQQRLRDAQEFYNADNLIDAQATLRPLLIADPENPAIITLTAQCYHKEGDIAAAVDMLDAMPPTDVAAYSEAMWLAAQWLAETNQFDEAQQRLEKILQLQGDRNRVYHKLASLLNTQGRRIEAAKYLRLLARSGDVSEKELIAMNTYGNMFIDESVPRPNFGGRLVKAELAQAKLFRSDGELDRARELAERLNRAFPESTQISAFLGRIYSDLREDERLREWLGTTPDGIEREPEYWFALASWLQRQSRHREAVRCFAEAVLRDETDLFSYLGLASSLTFLDQQAAAQRVQQRYQLLAEAARIATFLGKDVGSRQQLERMADILDQLQRPWEAVAWRAVAVKTHGGNDQEIEAIQRRRE